MNITEELLQTIYNRAEQVSVLKHYKLPTYIKIEDGYIVLVFEDNCCGEYNYYEEDLSLDELNKDIDDIIKQRKEKEEKERAEREKQLSIQKEEREKREKEERRRKWLELSKEFN